MPDIPEDLLRRSAEAKAKALGLPLEQVLAEMRGETPPDVGGGEPAEAAEPVPSTDDSAPTPDASHDSGSQVPDGSGDGRVTIASPPVFEASGPIAAAPAAGGRATTEAPATEPATEEPVAEEPAAEEPAAEEPEAEEPAAEEAPADEPAAEDAPAAAAPSEEEGAEEEGPAEETDRAAAVAVDTEEPPPGPVTQPDGSGNGRVAALVDPRPVAPAADTPEGVRTHRLLTVVKARAIQNVKAEPTDKVNTWPHLMIAEFTALMAMTVLLLVMSIALAAPLLEPANFNVTPNPSKAPWYFLGLQELLSYFDAQVAGVTVPTIIGLVGFIAIPYVDRNPSTKPSQRKYATMLYSFFLAGSASLTIIGVLFRGEGFNFAYPWSDGIFFDDLKDWVHFEGEP